MTGIKLDEKPKSTLPSNEVSLDQIKAYDAATPVEKTEIKVSPPIKKPSKHQI